MNNILAHPNPPSLPATAEDYLKVRKLKSTRTLNDMVEEVHLTLADNEDYARYLYAVWDEQAVEGSTSADNIMAAEMIRDRAKKNDTNSTLAKEKLATISKSLGVVLRRYNADRKTRRNMVSGTIVRNGDQPGTDEFE